MSALGGLLGLCFGCGILLIAAGLRGRDVDRSAGRWRPRLTQETLRRLLIDVLAGTVALAITGWPIAGIAAASAAALGPGWLRRGESTDQLPLVEALESWIETVRDVLQAGGLGLQTVIRASAPDAPRVIRADVQRLAFDCEHGSFDTALDAFAARIAHPACDQAVVGLHLHGAERLGEMLTSVAAALHREADLYRRIDAQRHPERLTVKAILYITVATLVAASLTTRSFLAPYGTLGGQVGLAGILAIIGLGVWWSAQAGRGEPPQRLLAPRQVLHR
ncbi:MAG TPA: hypothetical protein VN193_02880 [Candidatus Angelobacter sp.]|jgi:tight adherence protein B|nr:hypothetical protein [Candidatus Angelobacter sp.]